MMGLVSLLCGLLLGQIVKDAGFAMTDWQFWTVGAVAITMFFIGAIAMNDE